MIDLSTPTPRVVFTGHCDRCDVAVSRGEVTEHDGGFFCLPCLVLEQDEDRVNPSP